MELFQQKHFFDDNEYKRSLQSYIIHLILNSQLLIKTCKYSQTSLLQDSKKNNKPTVIAASLYKRLSFMSQVLCREAPPTVI